MSSQTPLVSVIIIFLDAGETFFKQAIASVFAQTYCNWELLLVDDGSTDISTKIARHYAEQYPDKVRYLEHEGHQNCGMSASRNLGINHAKGEYIALLDADDIWLPQKLEKQTAILAAQPEAEMVYGSTLMWHSWTGQRKDAGHDYGRKLGVPPDTLVKPPTLLTLFLTGKAETPGTCSVLMRRQLVQDVGGFENSFRGMYEDQAFFAKACLKAIVFVESGCWDKYRQHSKNSCAIAQAVGDYHPLEPHSAHLRFLTWLEQYLAEQKIENVEVERALKAAKFPYRNPRLYQLLKQKQDAKRRMKDIAKSIARSLPPTIQARLRAQVKKTAYCPPAGTVNFGDLRRVTPLSQHFGYDRGLPVDRYYIENFLAQQATAIQGRVLEIGDNDYTCRFGGDRVTQSDVLHVVEGNPQATIVGDLAENADHIPSNAFDCLVLTQTLHLIYDVRAALKTIYRILKPGGAALITIPGISQVSVDEWKDYWYWSFTTLSAQKLFEEVFPKNNLQIEAHGNVLTATAMLQGMATQELQPQELDYRDPSYQMLITVKAIKPESLS